MRAVLVANPKGGCGKTTLATYLAGCLASRGDSVVIWDIDRQKSLLEAFLKQFELPVLTFLRDTQVYANAAFQGKSIFDLPPYLNEKDVDDWKPLVKWLEK